MIDTQKTIIYTPESPLRRPLKLALDMVRDVKLARTLAWRLFIRDVSAQYRQTALGYLWALAPGLATSAIWIFLNYTQIVTIKSTAVSYPVFVLTGILFWQLFVEALNSPLNQTSSNRAMLSKISFPKEALIMSSMAQVLLSFLIRFVVFVGVLLLFHTPLELTALLLIFPVIALLLLGTAIGLLLTPIGILYRDIQQAVNIVVGLIMFLSPVVYPPPPEGLLSRIMAFNPLTPLIMTARDFLYSGISSSLTQFAIVFFAALALSIIAWLVFRLASPLLIERMDA
jgi:lipopolysaccharide transport system permease protein